jgi:hypothetical protein
LPRLNNGGVNGNVREASCGSIDAAATQSVQMRSTGSRATTANTACQQLNAMFATPICCTRHCLQAAMNMVLKSQADNPLLHTVAHHETQPSALCNTLPPGLCVYALLLRFPSQPCKSLWSPQHLLHCRSY